LAPANNPEKRACKKSNDGSFDSINLKVKCYFFLESVLKDSGLSQDR